MEQDTKFYKGIGYGLLLVIPCWILCTLTYFTVQFVFPESSILFRALVACAVMAAGLENLISFLVTRQLKKEISHGRDHHRV